MPNIATSGKFQINGLDIKSISHSALDGLVALVVTVLPMFAGANYTAFGHDITPGVVIAVGLLVKSIRKWATDHSIDVPPAV